MIKEAIILAGGLGTRLRDTVPDLPKVMASVADKPFLTYIIDYLRLQGVERFIFSLGYKSEIIEEFLSEHYPTLDYTPVIEEEPLGTGGAIELCLSSVREKNVLIVNGDTLFRIDLQQLYKLHETTGAECTLALKPMKNFDRYGVVRMDDKNCITAFEEKKYYEEGLINGGIYLLNAEKFDHRNFAEKFSFEKEYLEQFYNEGIFYGSVQDEYFIDIGVPEDFYRAGFDLKSSVRTLTDIDETWSLFLDRDGVINDERVGNYVLNTGEFKFSKGALLAMPILASHFKNIFVVSNQRGVGRGLMTEDCLHQIHGEMLKSIENAGGRIDRIYYCTDINDNCFYRKPNPGMAFKAKYEYPHIDLSKAVMVGNKPSDMRFGRAAGMLTVFVKTTNPTQPFPHPDIDYCYPTLLDFALALES